jgi:Mn-dependent DtxR family transcriptional regulator
MSEPGRPPGPDPERLALAWRIAPLSIDFILDIRSISRRDRDLIDSLLFATIIASNVAPLTQDAGLQLAYADLASPAPAEMRRPVSVNAVAQSMRIPFETARRRIRRMEKAGLLEVATRGVTVPQSVLQRPDFVEGILQRHDRIGHFYRELRSAGALTAVVAVGGAGDPPPVLITNRLTWEYVLRMADEMIAMTGDPLSSLILMRIVQHNIRGLGPDELAAWARNPTALGLPARTSNFAAELGLSAETARRYVMSLEAAGFLHRSTRGAVAVTPPALTPVLERMALDNLANVQRTFARLGQLGALAGFDDEARPGAAAAC